MIKSNVGPPLARANETNLNFVTESQISATVGQRWPNVMFPTDIDTQVKCVKCILAQCWPNVVHPTPTLQPTANVGPTMSCYPGYCITHVEPTTKYYSFILGQ